MLGRRIQRHPLLDRCNGQWASILMRLGILDENAARGNLSWCAICRDGEDRFHFDNRFGDGTYHCRKCVGKQAGNGIDLVQRANRCTFREAAELIESVIGGAAPAHIFDRPVVDKPTPERQRARASEMWLKARPIVAGDPVTAFHRRRRLIIESYPKTLKYEPLLPFKDAVTSQVHKKPGMLAKILGPDGKPVSLHRTWLTEDDSKPVRKFFFGLEVPPGSFIPLMAPRDGRIGVAEGIEKSFAASQHFDVPAYSLLSATNMPFWRPSPADGIRKVFIFGDNDAPGRTGAMALAEALCALGYEVEVHIPPDGFKDWEDVLKGGQR